MADITMCKGANCPHKEKCYRHTATPNDQRQSWFVKTPIDEKGKCDMYWGEQSESIWNQLLEITKIEKR